MKEKYWLDANVILRFLTGSPPDMAKQAKQAMDRAESGEVEYRVSPLIVAEVYWVLHSYYEFSVSEIRDVLSRFIRARGIAVENRERLEEALKYADEKNVDFVDAVLSLRAKENQETIITFDETDFPRLPSDWIHPEQL